MKPGINLLIKKAQASFGKKILTAAFAVSFLTATAFANEEEDKDKAIQNLKKEFKTAKDIQWKVTDNYIKASFTWNNQDLEVFYNYEGEEIARSKKIEPSSLPLDAQQVIDEKYSGYKYDETVEFTSSETGLYYYTSLVKENKKIILQVSSQGDVSVFQK
jgi:hypothetical protein